MRYAEDLTRLLEQELSLYSELLAATRAQQSVITGGDVARLAELVARAEGTIRKLRDVEVSLVELAREFATEALAVTEDPESAMAALLSSLDSGEAANVATLRDGIGSTLSDIASDNAVNAELLRDSLAYIENTMKMIAQADGTNSIYSRLGVMNRQAATVAVDDRA
ncbi:MAG: flagellar protein FlgN [Clostridia bacterium]|nr:flagellar protein FlgN [Clostridia bacterium]